jgi:hypothetical protein
MSLEPDMYLDVVDIYAKLFQNLFIHEKDTVRTQMCVPIISKCDSMNFQNASVSLTLK